MNVKEFRDTIEKEGWTIAYRELERYDDYTDWERNEDLVRSVLSSDLVGNDSDVKEIVNSILRFHIATYANNRDFLEDSARNMSIDKLLEFIDWKKLDNALDYEYRVLYSDQGEEVFVFEN